MIISRPAVVLDLVRHLLDVVGQVEAGLRRQRVGPGGGGRRGGGGVSSAGQSLGRGGQVGGSDIQPLLQKSIFFGKGCTYFLVYRPFVRPFVNISCMFEIHEEPSYILHTGCS